MPLAVDIHEEQNPRATLDRQLLARLARFARPHAGWMGLAVALSLLVVAADLLRPYLFKVGIDAYLLAGPGAEAGAPGFPASNRQGLVRLAALLMALTAVSRVAAYAAATVMQRAGQAIILRIRQELFHHIETRAVAFFDRHPSGRLVTRLTNDTEALSEFYSSVVVQLARDLFLLVGVAAAMVRLDAGMAAASLGAFPAVAVASWAFRRRMREAYRSVRLRLARVNAFLAENLNGMWLVKAFAREGRQLERFDRENEALRAASLQELGVIAVFRPMVDFLGNTAVAAVLVYGGLRILGGTLEYGLLYAFLNYLRQLFQPISDMAEKYNVIQSAMAAAERIFQILDDHTSLPEPAAPRSMPPRAWGRVELEGVWFAYPGGEWVLQDVSLTVEPGQMVGIVGATGAGKSSLVALIARFYDVQRGSVRIDGVDVREIPVAWLRRQVALVPQDPVLFAGTVETNIAFAVDGAAAGVEEAARRVGADGFIRALPGAYAYPVHPRGAGLSQGQRQLIALARAAAVDAPVLILDEATASVDSETEAAIQEALERLRGRYTLIVVAHRLATVRRADSIVVMHRGRVREKGAHGELMARRGLYWRLWQLQSLEAAQVLRLQEGAGA